jgi:hypothetical protein
MNRRDFLTALGGATAISTLNIPNLLAANSSTTSLYVKGLVMMSVEDPSVIRLGFPKAPGHKATLEVVPQIGAKRVLNFKGNGVVEANGLALSEPTIKVPELVSMKEFYGKSYRSLIAECPTMITIPRNAIQSITTANVSDDRYTFVRSDNGQEVNTFRPRQIAETIKIELSSAAVLKLDNGKVSIPLEGAKQLTADYSPAQIASNDGGYAEHFQHYFMYMERPPAADFDVVPKNLSAKSSRTPRIGNNFAMYFPITFCYMVEI